MSPWDARETGSLGLRGFGEQSESRSQWWGTNLTEAWSRVFRLRWQHGRRGRGAGVAKSNSLAARGCGSGSRKARHRSEGRESQVRELRDIEGAHDNKSVAETSERHLFFVKPGVG